MGTYSTKNSLALRQKALALTPGGVHSNVRLSGPQVFLDHGKGSRLTDVDGNDYIDYLLGQGPNFLGHAPDDIIEAVYVASKRGMIFGAQHELEIEAAELMLGALGWADLVRFGMSGTEAVQAALRAARAFTGRTKFIRFAGQYHGWLDNVLAGVGEDGSPIPLSAGQMGDYLDDSIMIGWNDLAVVEAVLTQRADEVAAIITEPIMLNAGSIEPRPGYLEGLRELCDRHGVVLIFDEVISGFRVALGGAAERYGVSPDLATYGKAMAGGWPVSAVAGKAKLMEPFGTGVVNHSGTLNSSVMACAAVAAAIKRLRGEPPYADLEVRGSRLQQGLRSLAADHDLDLNVQGLPMAFHVSFGQGPVETFDELQSLDLGRYVEFAHVLVEHGVWVTGRGIWYVSAAHTEADIDETLERVSAAMAAFAKGK